MCKLLLFYMAAQAPQQAEGLVVPGIVELFHGNFSMVDEPLLPTAKELEDLEPDVASDRMLFWMFAMMLIFTTTVATGTALTRFIPSHRHGRHEPLLQEDPSSNAESQQRQTLPTLGEGGENREKQSLALDEPVRIKLLAMVLVITCCACASCLAYSSATGRLSKTTGLDWELYSLLMLVNGLNMLVQAVVIACRVPAGEQLSWTAFAEASFSGMAPIFSDQYDMLKDMMFSFLCFESEQMSVKLLGVSSVSYLVMIHVYCFLHDALVASLMASHLPVLQIVLQTAQAGTDSTWIQILGILYKQLTPTRQRLLLLENIPQGIFALVYLRLEGGSFMVVILNLLIPTVQVLMTRWLFKPIQSFLALQLSKKLVARVKSGDLMTAKLMWDEAELGTNEGLFVQFLSGAHPQAKPEHLQNQSRLLLQLWKAVLFEKVDELQQEFGKAQKLDLSGLHLGDVFALVEAVCLMLEQRLGTGGPADFMHNAPKEPEGASA